MKLTNKLNLPQPIVDAVANDDYSRGNADISVTQLISPPRIVALTRAHWDELEEDVSDRIFSLQGQVLHTIFERAFLAGSGVRVPSLWDIDGVTDEQAHAYLDALRAFVREARMSVSAERRLFMTVDGWVVSGGMDRTAFIPGSDGSVVIQDYKNAGVSEMVRGVRIEREQQLNVYRVLAELNGYKVGSLQAIFFLRDWNKVRAALDAKKPRLGTAERKGAYPPDHVLIYDVPMWSIEDAYRYIAERVSLHRTARAVYTPVLGVPDAQLLLPKCTTDERWAEEPTLAVMKEGGERASKRIKTQEEGEEYIAAHPKDKYTIETRPGESIRCTYYCTVASVCDQWKGMQGA